MDMTSTRTSFTSPAVSGPGAEQRSFDWRFWRVVALLFLGAKLVLLVQALPFMDELYYWLWGQHPSASYFDHPPMVGWTAGLASVFGWNIVALRLPVLVTLLADLAILHALARHLRAEAWREAFWPMAAVFVSTPIVFGLTNLALPDHLLICATLFGVYAIERFRSAYAAGVPRWRWLYIAGLAFGLAMMSKYSGAVLSAGLVLMLLLSPRLRPILLTPHPWLALVLAELVQIPVLAWNIEHGLASFDFVLGGRGASVGLNGLWGYLLGFVFVLSPFILWPLGKVVFGRDEQTLFPRMVFWFSTLGFLCASFFTNILIHWNIVAYVAVLPFVALALRSRVLAVGHIVYGVLLVGVMATNFAVTSVQGQFSFVDQATAWSYGWDGLSAEVKDVADAADVDFIATTNYALAGPLAFALRDPDVTSLSPRTEAFDYWFDAPSHAGQSALILADRWRPMIDPIRARFASVELVRVLDVSQAGLHIDRYEIYIGRGYSPP